MFSRSPDLMFDCSSALLVAPYTVGKAAAGSVWRAVPDLVLRIFGRSGNLEAEARMSKTSTDEMEVTEEQTSERVVDVHMPDRRQEPPKS